MSDAPVAVEELSVSFGARQALRSVTFDVPPGTVVGVIGPNGAGKSTLFRALLGVVRHTGRVRVAGRPAYVPQGDRARHDFPATALDVVLMGLAQELPWWRPMGRPQRDAARSALAQTGIADLAERPFGELSGGQRQRVVLARALVRPSRVMLLDEPLTGVDPASADAILATIAARRADGAAILMATHDLSEAARTCDRLLLLNGRVVAYGPAERTLTPAALAGTYGSELMVVGQGESALAVLDEGSHHAGHDHGGA
jgi:ABC-type Mn2+/Zn2+ transport system ATPase subunit